MKATFPRFGYDTPALAGLMRDLGAKVRLPPPTTRRTIEVGVRHSPELICMPFKVTTGNFIEALDRGADTLFMAAGARRCRFGYYHYLQTRVLDRLGYRYRFVPVSQYTPYGFIFRLMPSVFGVSPIRVIRAVVRMFLRAALTEEFRVLLNRKWAVDYEAAERLRPQALARIERVETLRDIRETRRWLRERFGTDGRQPELRVGLVGEIFYVIERFANQEVEKELGRLGVEVVFERSLYRHLLHLLRLDHASHRALRLSRRYLRECPGGEARRTVGESVHFARDLRVDGLVHVFPFTCMAENIALESLQRLTAETGVPVLSLSFDEHTSQTGLLTRLEAFVDLLKRRKRETGIRRN